MGSSSSCCSLPPQGRGPFPRALQEAAGATSLKAWRVRGGGGGCGRAPGTSDRPPRGGSWVARWEAHHTSAPAHSTGWAPREGALVARWGLKLRGAIPRRPRLGTGRYPATPPPHHPPGGGGCSRAWPKRGVPILVCRWRALGGCRPTPQALRSPILHTSGGGLLCGCRPTTARPPAAAPGPRTTPEARASGWPRAGGGTRRASPGSTRSSCWVQNMRSWEWCLSPPPAVVKAQGVG
mmetsp:Transcript_68858/g.217728  ORF Transcript_68858/g.217728 Transcript_68858/m.217728 type:complete len:237 (+) Transcript_68858:111-821(+)